MASPFNVKEAKKAFAGSAATIIGVAAAAISAGALNGTTEKVAEIIVAVGTILGVHGSVYAARNPVEPGSCPAQEPQA